MLNAAACHPHGKTAVVVVATIIFSGQLALRADGAAELTAPHDERPVQQTACLQISDQCCED
jgi:hypothetical protein